MNARMKSNLGAVTVILFLPRHSAEGDYILVARANGYMHVHDLDLYTHRLYHRY